jgi:hypothetical protein
MMSEERQLPTVPLSESPTWAAEPFYWIDLESGEVLSSRDLNRRNEGGATHTGAFTPATPEQSERAAEVLRGVTLPSPVEVRVAVETGTGRTLAIVAAQ